MVKLPIDEHGQMPEFEMPGMPARREIPGYPTPPVTTPGEVPEYPTPGMPALGEIPGYTIPDTTMPAVMPAGYVKPAALIKAEAKLAALEENLPRRMVRKLKPESRATIHRNIAASREDVAAFFEALEDALTKMLGADHPMIVRLKEFIKHIRTRGIDMTLKNRRDIERTVPGEVAKFRIELKNRTSDRPVKFVALLKTPTEERVIPLPFSDLAPGERREVEFAERIPLPPTGLKKSPIRLEIIEHLEGMS